MGTTSSVAGTHASNGPKREGARNDVSDLTDPTAKGNRLGLPRV
jgi:hypothetical protein